MIGLLYFAKTRQAFMVDASNHQRTEGVVNPGYTQKSIFCRLQGHFDTLTAQDAKPPTDMKSQRSFLLLATLVFALLVGATYFPIFLGKVPIPADKILQFPPWDAFVRSQPPQETADIGD